MVALFLVRSVNAVDAGGGRRGESFACRAKLALRRRCVLGCAGASVQKEATGGAVGALSAGGGGRALDLAGWTNAAVGRRGSEEAPGSTKFTRRIGLVVLGLVLATVAWRAGERVGERSNVAASFARSLVTGVAAGVACGAVWERRRAVSGTAVGGCGVGVRAWAREAG